MDDSKSLHYLEVKFSDAAIDGLLAGIVAGVAMAAYLIVAMVFQGDSPAETLARFDPNLSEQPVTGALMHLAVSGVYGILFGLLFRLFGVYRFQKISPAFVGLFFGATLWLLAQIALLPATDSPLMSIPVIHLVLAHGVYGVILGRFIQRSRGALQQ